MIDVPLLPGVTNPDGHAGDAVVAEASLNSFDHVWVGHQFSSVAQLRNAVVNQDGAINHAVFHHFVMHQLAQHAFVGLQGCEICCVLICVVSMILHEDILPAMKIANGAAEHQYKLTICNCLHVLQELQATLNLYS